MRYNQTSTTEKILQFLSNKEEGFLFGYETLSECGTYACLRSSIMRLCKIGEVCRVCQGLYIKKTKGVKNGMFPDNITIAIEIDKKVGGSPVPYGDTALYLEKRLNRCPKILNFRTTSSTRSLVLSDGTVVKYYKPKNSINKKSMK